MSDRIEKRIELHAPISKVWAAITDYRQFGEWFRVNLQRPFVVGESSRGFITYPGYEHLEFKADVQQMNPKDYFSFTWHPYAIDPSVDYEIETPTLVEFHLASTETGTMLTITESGFANIPAYRRSEAFWMNEGGWSEQLNNIKSYLAKG